MDHSVWHFTFHTSHQCRRETVPAVRHSSFCQGSTQPHNINKHTNMLKHICTFRQLCWHTWNRLTEFIDGKKAIQLICLLTDKQLDFRFARQTGEHQLTNCRIRPWSNLANFSSYHIKLYFLRFSKQPSEPSPQGLCRTPLSSQRTIMSLWVACFK